MPGQLRLAALIFWVISCAVALAQVDSTNTVFTRTGPVKEERLGAGLYPAMITQSLISPDGRHVALVQQLPSKRLAVFVDGRPGPEFDWIGFFIFSREGGHYAYVGRNGRQEVVIRDGQTDAQFDKVVDEKAFNQLAFSLDGRHLAHWARKGKWRVYLDGRPGPEFDRLSGPNSLVFSLDGNRLAYAGEKSGKTQVVVDGRIAGEYDLAPETSPQFSWDGQHCAFIVKLDGQSRVMLDGQASEGFAEVGPFLCFSPDSRRLAYTVRKDDRWRACLDGQLGYAYDGIVPFVSFSPNSKRFAYVAERAAKFQVVIDNQPGPAFDEIQAFEYVWVHFSPDSQRTAYGARVANKWVTVVDGRLSRGYDQILPTAHLFSANGKHVAFAARNGPLWMLVWDGEPGTPFDELGPTPLLFSLDGEQYAYTGRRGGQWIPIINGHEGKGLEGIGALDVFSFSPDSKRVAFVARPQQERVPDGSGKVIKGNYFVVVDGQSGPGFPLLLSGPRFSPDSRHVVYSVKRGMEQLVVVLDGIPGPEYEEIFAPGPVFFNPGGVEYLALRQGTLYRVTQPAPAR